MYIRAKSRTELAELIAPFMKQAGLPSEDRAMLEGVAGLVQERVKVLSEVPGMVRFIFEEPAVPAAADLLPKKADAARHGCGGLRRLDRASFPSSRAVRNRRRRACAPFPMSWA